MFEKGLTDAFLLHPMLGPDYLMQSCKEVRMQFQFFVVPISDSHEATEELNRFLRSRKVLDTRIEWVGEGVNSLWCVCVKYLDQAQPNRGGGKEMFRGRIDYKAVLSPVVFDRFSVLRERRNQIAREEGVPAFSIFTNEQLAGLAELDHLDTSSMKTIPGIGPGKIARYAERIVGQANVEMPADSGEPDEKSKGDLGAGG